MLATSINLIFVKLPELENTSLFVSFSGMIAFLTLIVAVMVILNIKTQKSLKYLLAVIIFIALTVLTVIAMMTSFWLGITMIFFAVIAFVLFSL